MQMRAGKRTGRHKAPGRGLLGLIGEEAPAEEQQNQDQEENKGELAIVVAGIGSHTVASFLYFGIAGF